MLMLAKLYMGHVHAMFTEVDMGYQHADANICGCELCQKEVYMDYVHADVKKPGHGMGAC